MDVNIIITAIIALAVGAGFMAMLAQMKKMKLEAELEIKGRKIVDKAKKTPMKLNIKCQKRSPKKKLRKRKTKLKL